MNMIVYTLEQCWEILRHYFKNHGNVAESVQIAYGFWKKRSTVSSVYSLSCEKKVEETGILSDKPKREKPKSVHTPENIAAVAESVCETPSTSTSTN